MLKNVAFVCSTLFNSTWKSLSVVFEKIYSIIRFYNIKLQYHKVKIKNVLIL